MAIDKIIKIEGLGRFKELTPSGDVQFRRLTLIYGENGSGKTTIAGLLRSLATGDYAYVAERATLGADGPPRAELRVAGGNARLADRTWTQTLPQLEIFDTTFVSENVHAGEWVDLEHRKNLYQVVVGQAAVALANRIGEIDAESRSTVRRITEIERILTGHIQGPFDLDEFLDLPADKDVKEDIAEHTSKLGAVRKAKEIVARPQLHTLTLPSAPRHLLDVLRSTIEETARDAQREVQEHIRAHFDSRGEQWIRQGLGYVRDDTCPFCTQSLSGIGILDLFRQYFSSKYEDQVVAIQRALNELGQTFAEEVLARLQKQVIENDGRIQTWHELADLGFASVSIDRLEGSWKHLKQTLGAALQKKLANPAERLANEAEIEAAIQDYETTASQVLEHGKEITQANDQIAQLKQQAAASDEAELEAKLRRLRNMQIRGESDVTALCNELKELRKRKSGLDSEKSEKRGQLRTESESLLSAYEADINGLLARFGASFRITGTRPHFAGGPASSTYQLEINGVALDLGDSRTPRGTPCFRTALSAGDKSTLALAFFLARLQRDPSLDEKIVVFDDPLSSLDCFRSTFTQQEVARLARQAVQVVVLSHDPFFLKGISDAAEDVPTKSMRVVRSGETATLREWNVDEYCLAQAHKDYFVLRSFLDNGLPDGGELETVARAIRPYVEGYLRHRYPDRFPAGQMLGTLIQVIREAGEGDDLASLKSKLPDLEDINGYARRFMHDHAAACAAQPTSDTELRTYVTRAMDFVRGE